MSSASTTARKTNDAIALSPGKTKLCTALLVIMGFALGSSEFAVIGIESELANDLGVSLSAIGQLISLFALPYAIMTPILALTTGRFKRYSLLKVYCVVFIVGNLIAALATSYGMLLFARIVMGTVAGTLLAVGTTYIPELVGTERMGFVISVVYGAYSVAMIVATSLGKIAADAFNWHVVMWATFVLSLAVGIALLAVMPRSGSTDEPATFKEQFGLLKEPCILIGMLIFVFGVGAVYVFYGFVTPYLEQILGMDTVAASTTLLAFGAICLVSNLTGGWIDTRFGMPAVPVIFVLLAVVLGSITLAGGAMPISLVLVFGVALLMYTFSIACITLFMRIAHGRHPKAMTLATSIEPMAFNIGIAFGSAVGGLIIAGPGIITCGAFGAAFSLIAAILALITIRFSKKL